METAEQLWQAFLKAHPEALSGELSLAEINRKMAAFVKRLNERPNPDFDGLSRARCILSCMIPSIRSRR
jgi:hypothetical protein